MNLDQRLARIENSPQMQGVKSERRKRRIMELIALGTLRLKGRGGDVSRMSEAELLSAIGADKESYERALSAFIVRRKGVEARL